MRDTINDQFEHGRIPIKPLSFKNKNLALANELVIDYGEGGNYHIYIKSSTGDKLIDITETIAKNIINTSSIDADNLTITVNGETEPISIRDILNTIYDKYLYPENNGSFNYGTDIEKMKDDDAINTLLRDKDGRVVLPVTFADNIIFKDGSTLANKTNEKTRMGISRFNFETSKDKKTYEFTFPFKNYIEDIQVRYNGLYLDESKFSISPFQDNQGNFTTGIIKFLNHQVEANDSVNIIFIYNSKADKDYNHTYMDGKNISFKSLPTNRLSKIEHMFYNDDKTAVASASSVYNLFKFFNETMANNPSYKHAVFIDETPTDAHFISITNRDHILDHESQPKIIEILIQESKNYDARIKIDNDQNNIIKIIDANENELTKSIPGGRLLKFIFIDTTAMLIENSINDLKVNRWVHKCNESEQKIMYDGMYYPLGSVIHVYRNGIRLFEDIHYSINTKEEFIYLFNRSEDGDVIVFEALHL